MASNNPSSSLQSGASEGGGGQSPEGNGGYCDLDEEMPRRGESKRKRFHPFRAVRNIFRRNKRQGVDEETGTSKKSRSTSELSTVHVPGELQTFEVLAPPYAAGLSVSHDSIFTPEHNVSTLDPEQPMPASSLSVQHVAGLKRFQDELLTRVRARRDSDDDDAGLPQSPCTSPTTADVLAQGLKDKPCAGSLISMGSSENDEDSGGVMSSSHSSRMSLSERRNLDFEGELDVSQPVPLNHNAALHKISVRPKRTHGLPRHRKLQQIAAAAVTALPATPEVTEDPAGLKTPSTHSEEDRAVESKPEEKILNTVETLELEEEPIYDEVNTEEEPTLVQEDIKPLKSSSPELFLQLEKTSTPDLPETIPSPKSMSPLPVSPVPNDDVAPVFTNETETPENQESSEVVSPETSRVATPVSLESAKISSKSKSTAAELKLRHEIKQFSKRQKELKEEMLKKSEEEEFEIIDVKECSKSLESVEKTSPTKEIIEEDMTVVSAERFFTPIDRSSAPGRENKIYKPISTEPSLIETESTTQQISVVQETKTETKITKSKGHLFTVNDVGPTNEEKFTSTILVSNTSDAQRTEMSVISSSDITQRIPVERPPRKKTELHEAKNRLTSGLVTVDNQSFSACSTLKLESDFKQDTPEVTLPQPPDIEWIENLEANEQKDESTLAEELDNIEHEETKLSEVEQDTTTCNVETQPTEEKKEPEREKIQEEKPKVVLRKHTEKSSNRGSVEASAFSSLDFECIMKQRRSITENDIVGQKVVADDGPRTPEVKSGQQTPSKRLSVEIVPYNTRVKENAYLSSPPPKTMPENEKTEKEVRKTEDTPVDIQRKLSFSKPETATTSSNEDLSKHPVQFRIRRGKSLNEKSDSISKESISAEKPKLTRPKSQLGLLTKPTVEKPIVPEFMKIQLRSSKEELDVIKNEGNVTPPQVSTPKTPSPTPSGSVPQWEVKIGSQKRQQSLGSVSLPPLQNNIPEIKEVKKKEEKVVEKVVEKVSTPDKRKETNVENKENMGSTNVLVKEDVKDDIVNGNEPEETKFTRSTSSPGAIRDDRRKSQGYVGAGMGTDAEPELFRVFARRSIKQRNPDKIKQKEEKVVPSEPQTTQPKEVKDIKPVVEKTPIWKNPKPIAVEKPKDITILSKENPRVADKVKESNAKEVKIERERSNSPQRPRFRAKSVLVNETPIPPRERKTSAPTEVPKITDKLDNKEKKHVKEVSQINSKNWNASLSQVSVNIKQETTPVRKSSISNSPPIIKNTPASIMDTSNGSLNTPAWLQLAQQRREQREQKDRKICGSSSNSFVLDSNNAVRPSRNSKVLDLVHNFQKLQTT